MIRTLRWENRPPLRSSVSTAKKGLYWGNLAAEMLATQTALAA